MDISPYTLSGIRDLERHPHSAHDRDRDRTQASATAPSLTSSTDATDSPSRVARESGLFETLVDTVNPLQHIPGVSTVYQASTGDTTAPLAAMAGGFLFGGPIGLAAGAAGSFLEWLTGKSLAEHATALFSDSADDAADNTPVQTAQADGPNRPMLEQITPQGLSLEHYQLFAEAEGQRRPGFGAARQEAALASKVWTDRTLKDAMDLYETQSTLGAQSHTTRTGDDEIRLT